MIKKLYYNGNIFNFFELNKGEIVISKSTNYGFIKNEEYVISFIKVLVPSSNCYIIGDLKIENNIFNYGGDRIFLPYVRPILDGQVTIIAGPELFEIKEEIKDFSYQKRKKILNIEEIYIEFS